MLRHMAVLYLNIAKTVKLFPMFYIALHQTCSKFPVLQTFAYSLDFGNCSHPDE